jgi:hypothetical protein
MLCTVLLHVAGLALSFLYGEIIVAWIGGKLVDWAGFVSSILFRLNSRPFVRLPHAMLHTFLDHLGLIWLCLALFIQLGYLLRYLRRRMKKRHLGTSYAGNPGGQYWENIQRRFKDYQQAILRWEPKFALRTPTWYYYKRQESSQPGLFWRGHKLVIEKDLLKAEHAQELAPLLARELMYYNCDDVTFKGILAYYPDHFSRWQMVLHLLGLCYFLPVMFMLWFFWPSYWEKRILIADKFAYYLGQGHLLYLHIQVALQLEEQDKQKRREITREIQKLKEQMRAQEDDNSFGFTLHSNGYTDSSNGDSKRLARQLEYLQQWEQHLLKREQQAFEMHPMLEQRREQLVALLGTEQTWMEQHGIAPPVQATTLSPVQEPRRLQSRTDQNDGTSQTHSSQ